MLKYAQNAHGRKEGTHNYAYTPYLYIIGIDIVHARLRNRNPSIFVAFCAHMCLSDPLFGPFQSFVVNVPSSHHHHHHKTQLYTFTITLLLLLLLAKLCLIPLNLISVFFVNPSRRALAYYYTTIHTECCIIVCTL